jgi:peptide/nickel transport system substrate-binding protein
LNFATDKPPFNDKRVRQAVSMCFDREKQLKILYDGRGKVDHVLTLAMWGSLPLDKLGKASKYFRPNVEEAKRLVKAAGYKTPLKFSMAFCAGYGTVVLSATEALAGQLNSSRVFSVTLAPQEYGAYISGTYRGKFKEDSWYGPTTPPVEPDEILWDLLHSTSPRNGVRVKDPHLDKLIEAQRRELDEKKRLEILKEIQYYLAEQMYIMPTTARPVLDILYPYVKGWNRHNVPAYNIGDRERLVWIDK